MHLTKKPSGDLPARWAMKKIRKPNQLRFDRRTFLERLSVVVSILFPVIFGLGLDVYVDAHPHVIKYMDGKYLTSASLLIATVLTYFTTRKYIKSTNIKVLIRLPIFVIYIALAYLLTIRSYCDPEWFGDVYDDGSGSSGCVDEAPARPR